MKKKLLLLLSVACVCCLSVALLVGCDNNNDTKQSEKSYLGDDEKFVVGFDENFPPFGYRGDDGEYTGFDLELAQEVAKRNGWEYEPMAIDWDTKDAQIDSGTIDVIWNGFTKEGREGQFEFTEPYYTNDQIILTRDNSGITTFEDLAGKTVVAQVNSPAYDQLAEGGDYYESLGSTFKSLETVPDYNTALMNLESGAADAVAIDLPAAQTLIQDKDGYVILDTPVSSETYAVGAKTGNTELTNAIQATLIEMYKDGTVEEIASHYPGQITIDKWILQ